MILKKIIQRYDTKIWVNPGQQQIRVFEMNQSLVQNTLPFFLVMFNFGKRLAMAFDIVYAKIGRKIPKGYSGWQIDFASANLCIFDE